MKTSIILIVRDAHDKKRKRSFSDINPNATNAELKNFATTVVGLTTSSYVETSRVNTINVDEEETNLERTITIENAVRNEQAIISVAKTASGSVNPFVIYYSNGGVQLLSTNQEASTDPLIAKFSTTIPNTAGSLCIGVAKGTKFRANFVIQEVE